MILKEKIKNKLLTFYTKRLQFIQHQKINKKLQAIPPCTNNIGILYKYETDNPQKTAAVTHFAQQISARGKSVQLLCYNPAGSHLAKNPFPTFNKYDINAFGKALQPAIQNFWETPFDNLYYLETTTEPVLDYLIFKSTAKYKIANFIPEKVHLFEINFKNFVEPHEKINFDVLFNKMLTYTTQLQLQ